MRPAVLGSTDLLKTRAITYIAGIICTPLNSGQLYIELRFCLVKKTITFGHYC